MLALSVWLFSWIIIGVFISRKTKSITYIVGGGFFGSLIALFAIASVVGPAQEKKSTVVQQTKTNQPQAEPYEYRIIEKQDYSYGKYKNNPAADRMAYKIYLKTFNTPDPDKMKATAQQIWKSQNKRWDEFTVFMIFGLIEDFSLGAYGIATFSSSVMTEFKINEYVLQELKTP